MKSNHAEELGWYRHALVALQTARVPFLIGGAYALWNYTGVRRPTKDLDLFLRGRDLRRALTTLRKNGCHAEITARHWLGKATYKDFLIDFIIGLANGVSRVDDSWFKHAVRGRLFDLDLEFVSLEDMIWAKAFVMERDRFDGADIAHLILTDIDRLDWKKLHQRFVGHEPVLLSHLALFTYIYPFAAHRVPRWLLRQGMASMTRPPTKKAFARLCRGTLFSRTQYVMDIERQGLRDARLPPFGPLTAAQILE